jgi:heme exporter protein B
VVLFALGAGWWMPQALSTGGRPAVLWVAVLLAGLLVAGHPVPRRRRGRLARAVDAGTGTAVPGWWLCAHADALGHHRAAAVIVAVPLLGELLHLPRAQLPVLMVSAWLLGTPLLSLLGAVVAALTVGMRRAGVLVALLALAAVCPGAGVRCRQSVAASAQGLDAVGALAAAGRGPGAGRWSWHR